MMTPATLWRIYTVQRANLPGIVRSHFDGATISPATGIFRGMREASAVIEILGGIEDEPRVRALAADIRRTNNQRSVLIAAVPGVGLIDDTGAPDVEIEYERIATGEGATVN